MTLIGKKAQGGGPERLRRLVAEHLETLEPGLCVLDTSLRLGRSTVDVVAVDGKQTLVLVTVAEVADVPMLVSTLDAYIWCLAFPDNLRRLYPNATIAAARPPRIVFVAAKMPTAFLELVERLSVINPECHELAPAIDRDGVLPATPAPAAVPPEPMPEPVALQPAGRLDAGFDTAVAQQWESFLTESVVAAPVSPAGPPAPVAASTPTWPPRVPPHRSLGKSSGQSRSGQTQRTDEADAPAANGHSPIGHVANGHAGHGHPAAVHGPRIGKKSTPIADAAEALLTDTMRAAEPALVEHAAVDLGIWQQVEIPSATALPTAPTVLTEAASPAPPPGAARTAGEPEPAAARPAHEETRTVNHPALQALRFPKSGVSRQWQEFLDQLAANQ